MTSDPVPPPPSAPLPVSPSTVSPPPADLPVDERRVRRLLEELDLEPGVEHTSLQLRIGPAPLGEGWDNVLWPVGEHRPVGEVRPERGHRQEAGADGRPVVLRVVRREAARPLLVREAIVLRLLNGAGPLPMRIPDLLGTHPEALLVTWTPGAVAASAPAAQQERAAMALAAMLGAVHSLPLTASLERNPVRGVPLATRAAAFARDLDRAELPVRAREEARRRWERGLGAATWAGPDLLLHGDPHPGNLVAPEAGIEPPALIDWGDATPGDPASDLGALLLHHPDATILARYREAASWRGVADEAVWAALVDRAGAWSVRLALALVTAYPAEHPLGWAGRRLLDA
ncbi:phosphotransferase [Brachybacterium squillarum]|uniref:phosphotransferase n=1 Tax=Brachybacterium squillarum TaxID=661979 RepID=UPI002222AD58|nr:phosphotransferase [Brachybacterium squillarum]MCW1803903.1 phosphotransferase [Brachybacterium squillarum]